MYQVVPGFSGQKWAVPMADCTWQFAVSGVSNLPDYVWQPTVLTPTDGGVFNDTDNFPTWTAVKNVANLLP